MMDEWTVPCKELTSGEMRMVDKQVYYGQLFFFF